MKTTFGGKEALDWARSPSPAHEKARRAGSAWESAIVAAAEAGDERFVAILRGHVNAGVIRGDRATRLLNTLDTLN